MMETNPQTTGQAKAARKLRRARKAKRTIGGAIALTFGLTGAGLLANALTPDVQEATASQSQAALAAEGKQLYDVACVTCHGENLQGIADRGPSLVGVGEGAVYFQVHSGRMPMIRNEAQALRKTPRFSEQQMLAIAAYVNSAGGGPALVRHKDGSLAMQDLRGTHWTKANGIDPADVARGSDLFRLNCASCHNFTGEGGALSSGKFAPPLAPANEQEIYQAMLTGPQQMPKFADRQLSPDEKKDIIAFIKSQKDTPTQGGYGLGGIGPVTEGMWMWLVGVSIMIAAALWIGSKS